MNTFPHEKSFQTHSNESKIDGHVQLLLSKLNSLENQLQIISNKATQFSNEEEESLMIVKGLEQQVKSKINNLETSFVRGEDGIETIITNIVKSQLSEIYKKIRDELSNYVNQCVNSLNEKITSIDSKINTNAAQNKDKISGFMENMKSIISEISENSQKQILNSEPLETDLDETNQLREEITEMQNQLQESKMAINKKLENLGTSISNSSSLLEEKMDKIRSSLSYLHEMSEKNLQLNILNEENYEEIKSQILGFNDELSKSELTFKKLQNVNHENQKLIEEIDFKMKKFDQISKFKEDFEDLKQRYEKIQKSNLKSPKDESKTFKLPQNTNYREKENKFSNFDYGLQNPKQRTTRELFKESNVDQFDDWKKMSFAEMKESSNLGTDFNCFYKENPKKDFFSGSKHENFDFDTHFNYQREGRQELLKRADNLEEMLSKFDNYEEGEDDSASEDSANDVFFYPSCDKEVPKMNFSIGKENYKNANRTSFVPQEKFEMKDSYKFNDYQLRDEAGYLMNERGSYLYDDFGKLIKIRN